MNLDIDQLPLSEYKNMYSYLVENNIGNIIQLIKSDDPYSGFNIKSLDITEEEAVLILLKFGGELCIQ